MVKCSGDDLDNVFFALSDPTRRAILQRLAKEGEIPVTALAEPFEMSLPAVSKHLRVLQRAGLLVQEKDGRIRRCQLVAEPLQGAALWIEQYSRFWQAQFEALADYLTQIQAQEEGRANGGDQDG
jgi:DNA-binding transcriptional ArsR family regulator